MKIDVKKARIIIRILLIALIVLTVVFIFSNSMKSKSESSKQSSTVGEIIAEIIPPDTTLGAKIQKNIRKIAHFTEYGALGIEIALYIWLFCDKKLKVGLISEAFAFFVGFIDETIQIFFDRGPSIGDVWIDVGGFTFFTLIAHGVIFTGLFSAKKIIAHRRAKAAASKSERQDIDG